MVYFWSGGQSFLQFQEDKPEEVMKLLKMDNVKVILKPVPTMDNIKDDRFFKNSKEFRRSQIILQF